MAPLRLPLLAAAASAVLLLLSQPVAASCDVALDDAQAHVVSWSNPLCGSSVKADVLWNTALPTGTGTGSVVANTCCAPTCEAGFKPTAPAGGAECVMGSLPVTCVEVDCAEDGPRPRKDLTPYAWMRTAVVIFSLVGACSIGANNYGNGVAIAVASQATHLRGAALGALVLEVLGAFLLGWRAPNVLFSDVVDLDVFGDNPEILMQAMVCVSLSVAMVMFAFSFLGVPVSAMHITVGGLAGVVNVWQNSMETAREELEIAGVLVPPGGCGKSGEDDCVNWGTVMVRLYVVGMLAPLAALLLAYTLRKCVIKDGTNRPGTCQYARQVLLSFLWGFPVLYALVTQVWERLLATKQPLAKSFMTKETPSFSAWDNGDYNPWMLVVVIVIVAFWFAAAFARAIYSCTRAGRDTETICDSFPGPGAVGVFAFLSWILFIGALFLLHYAYENDWRGKMIPGAFVWVWVIFGICAFMLLVGECLALWTYGAPCIGGGALFCRDRQLGDGNSGKSEPMTQIRAQVGGGDTVLVPKRTRACMPCLVDCCNDERDQHSRAWRCRLGGCCRRVNHAESPNFFLTYAPRAFVDCVCAQDPMEPVREIGVGQGVSYHADAVDNLEALKLEGNDFFRVEEYHEAIAAYTAAINIAPEASRAPLHCNRSAAHNRLGHKDDFQMAKEDAEIAIDLKPSWAKPHHRLGEANEKLGNFKLARASFERALELEPEERMHRDALYRVLADGDQQKRKKGEFSTQESGFPIEES